MAKAKKNQPIRSWEAGDTVQGFALLTKKEQRQDKNNRGFLDLELADASGSIVAKVWADSPALAGQFEAHQFVAFRGAVKSYRDQLQISIDECREATPADREHGFDEALLVPSTREDIADLWERLERLMTEQVRRPVLRRLTRETLDAYGPELREHPAAKSMHHAYRGGLLFHDLGKLRELGAMPANDYTLEGRLIGHVVIGRDLLRERCAVIPDFPRDLELLLEHMILSHQGKKEFSSPVEPMTPEAVALHFVDDLDSKLNQLRTAREGTPGILYHRGLGRYMYLPAPEPQGPTEESAGLPLISPDEPNPEPAELPQPSLFKI